MAGKKENIKALFSNTRSRVIIIFTIAVLLFAVIFGLVKFAMTMSSSTNVSTNIGNAPADIRSIPGAVDQTAQYAELQEKQNVEQAQQASKVGGSAIPTIIHAQTFGKGIQSIGQQQGQGGVGFEGLLLQNAAGEQQSLWLQSLKDTHCAKSAVQEVTTQGASLSDLKEACSCIQLKDNGYGFTDLEHICSCKELKAAGFNARDMRNAGFSASKLKVCGFDACELRSAGLTAQEMKDGGFSDGELKGAGYSENEIARASGLPDGIKEKDVQAAGCQAEALRRLNTSGVSASAIRRISGCSLAQLKAAGFSPKDLKNAGFSAADLLKNGFTPDQLKQAGYAARDLLDAGLTPAQLAAAGFNPEEIKTAETELPVGMTENDVKAAGCSADALKREKLAGVSAALIRQYAGCNEKALKEAGFTDADLSNAGFTPKQLNEASVGATDAEIKSASCDPQKLKELIQKGVSAKRIRDLNGCSAQTLKDAGFDAKALSEAAFTPQQLLAAGFTPEQINAANTGDDANIRAAGCDPAKLQALFTQGVSAKRIHDLNGCSADVLKKAGYTAKDLVNAGYSPKDLVNADFTPNELVQAGLTPEQVNAAKTVNDAGVRAAGCDPAKLQALFSQGVLAKRIHELNGCSADVLKKAGYGAKDLINAGFTPAELLGAGFTPQQIVDASKAIDDEIKAAGCDPQKLTELLQKGISAKHIKELNGCSLQALKDAGFDARALTDAGFSPQQLQAAGFTPEQIKDAQSADNASVRAAGCDPIKLHALFAQGVSAKRIHDLNGCTADALKKAGYTAKDLVNAGFTPTDLLNAGFNPNDLVSAGLTPEQVNAAQTVNDAGIHAAGCDPAKLQALFSQGVLAKRIHDLNGCSADALKKAGYAAKDLVNAGYTQAELQAAGFSPKELGDAGLVSEANKSPSVSDSAIRAAGCDPDKIRDLLKQGVLAKQIHELNGCSAAALKKGGYDAKNLADAGFSPADLLAAGFTPRELSQAGLTPSAIIASGRTANCSEASLKAALATGVSASTVKQTLGCNAAEMAKAGYTPAELKKAGFTAAELKQAGFSAADLKKAGFNAKELAAAGFAASELKQAGFNAKQLMDAGFSAASLKNAGFSALELKEAGFGPAELSKAGFSLDELTKAGFSSKELKGEGVMPSTSSLEGLEEVAVEQKTPTKVVVKTETTIGKTPLTAAEEAHTKQLQEIMKRQQTAIADQKYQQLIQQRLGAMLPAANSALQGWRSVSTQVYVGGNEMKAVAGAKVVETRERFDESVEGTVVIGKGPRSGGVIKAGDILFAVMDTSVNSDEPGPILATIVSGKLKGSKLIGSFNLASNANKMTIVFNVMSVPGADKTTSVHAFAIEPDTARTALSSKTNHHYLLRYGSLFAATFIEGFGNAFQSAGTTVLIGGTGGVTQTTISNGVGRSTLENAVIGLATLGKAWGQVAQQQFSRPTTVEVYAGTAIGVLFTQDVRIF